MLTQSFLYLVQLGGASSDLPAISSDQSGGYDFVDLANKAVAYALLFAGALSVVFMFIGGISFILSGGKEDKVKEAVSTIRYALLGLIVTILSITVISLVGQIFHLQLVRYLSFSYIIETVNGIFSSNN